MTDSEFTTWLQRLYVGFPLFWDWTKKLPDPLTTQSVWRNCLRPYTLKECMWVLECWENGKLQAPENYERDKVHLLARSYIETLRTKAKATQETHDTRKLARTKQVGPAAFGSLDSEMRQVLEIMVPRHRLMVAGDLSESDYRAELELQFEKFGFNRQPEVVATPWSG